MDSYTPLLRRIIRQSKQILGPSLIGIYLHGSAAMGCFHEKNSDIDLLVVVKEGPSRLQKRQYLDMIAALNEQAPAKGIELSIVRENACKPFVYPTPYEFHFSPQHLDWYRSDPESYVEKMKGTDPDLAAHFTITYHRGKTLYGKEIPEVFAEVGEAEYFDSIWRDIENAREDIIQQPVYFILNLCRVLAYRREHLILSKQEGGSWGLAHLPQAYVHLAADAVTEYETGIPLNWDKSLLQAYAGDMLLQIQDGTK